MIFNSVGYLIFLPIVLLIYFIVPNKIKWIVLLTASYYFYMSWNPKYILLLLFFTVFNYLMALMIEKCKKNKQKKMILIICITINLTILFIFKYYNFFIENLNLLLSELGVNGGNKLINIILPMGISFYTFQTMSYVIDVYKNKIRAEKRIGIFALFVSFFPQLVAGPIERTDNLLPQFYEKKTFNYIDVTIGLKLMLWGFFKKIVIADRIAVIANTVYNNPYNYSGLPLIIATIAFGIQIYCDFSGYSDIAIGTARIMGFKLVQNFNRPYFSKSISEFWRRWHISLSSWFRDYIYIPLGGNRKGQVRAYANLFITFLISGLWHGANWTFVIWGALHGLYLVIGKITKPIRKKVINKLNINTKSLIFKVLSIFTTNCFVMFAWIFFRANSIDDAMYIVKNLFVNFQLTLNLRNIIATLFNLGLNNVDTIVIVLSLIILLIVSLIERKGSWVYLIQKKPLIFRFSIYYILIIYVIFFMFYIGNSQFIYFQF